MDKECWPGSKGMFLDGGQELTSSLKTGKAPTAYDIAPMMPTLFISALRDGSTSTEYTSSIVKVIEEAEPLNVK